MGDDDGGPQPGFDQWVSFKGQGTYLPTPERPQRRRQEGAAEGLHHRRADRLHAGLAEGARHVPAVLPVPVAQGRAPGLRAGRPAQGHAGHAAAAAARRARPTRPSRKRSARAGCATSATAGTASSIRTTRQLDIARVLQAYAETLRGVDDSIGRVLDYLKSEGQLDSTLVIYMGDNGFAFGEHGLIDKRTAYEESMRVPMVVQCPELFAAARRSSRWWRTSTSRRRSCPRRACSRRRTWMGASMLPLAQGQDGAVAEGTALRVLLGAQLSADADDLRAARPTGTSSSATTASGTSTSCST